MWNDFCGTGKLPPKPIPRKTKKMIAACVSSAGTTVLGVASSEAGVGIPLAGFGLLGMYASCLPD